MIEDKQDDVLILKCEFVDGKMMRTYSLVADIIHLYPCLVVQKPKKNNLTLSYTEYVGLRIYMNTCPSSMQKESGELFTAQGVVFHCLLFSLLNLVS